MINDIISEFVHIYRSSGFRFDVLLFGLFMVNGLFWFWLGWSWCKWRRER